MGVVVDDLAAARAFFVELGHEPVSEMSLENASVDRIVGLEGVRTDVVMMQTPDGHGRLELIEQLRALRRPRPSGSGEGSAGHGDTPLHLQFIPDGGLAASPRSCPIIARRAGESTEREP